MIVAYRLVRLIERHSQELAREISRKIAASDRCPSYRHVPAEDLERAVGEHYPQLGEWLLSKTEADIRGRYETIGARRAAQGVPVHELLWAIVLVKENLWEFLRREAEQEQTAEVFAELEVCQLLDQFFDRALYFAVLGHGRALAGQPARL